MSNVFLLYNRNQRFHVFAIHDHVSRLLNDWFSIEGDEGAYDAFPAKVVRAVAHGDAVTGANF